MCVCVFVRACVRAHDYIKQQPDVVLSRITKSTREGLKVRANVTITNIRESYRRLQQPTE